MLALNNDVVMMNDHARQVLSAPDQAALLAAAAEAMMGSKRAAIASTASTSRSSRANHRSPPLGHCGMTSVIARATLVQRAAGAVYRLDAPVP
ncbi:hypothetical protein [Streptomyces sp. RPT161]|uniref:hypothetical protein n=1 Tax=Streptomyces sp. RPT161 TaxID=3015993 RepID=UPI0022B8D967|nr:hypothetical protein [Streptomyces sp. RPT161]